MERYSSMRLIDYDAFMAWVRVQAKMADKSSKEWEAAFPKCRQASYRSGMWYAYHDMEREALRFDFLARKPKILL